MKSRSLPQWEWLRALLILVDEQELLAPHARQGMPIEDDWASQDRARPIIAEHRTTHEHRTREV